MPRDAPKSASNELLLVLLCSFVLLPGSLLVVCNYFEEEARGKETEGNVVTRAESGVEISG